MNKLQKWGGIAALYEAAVYVLGIGFFVFMVDYIGVVDPLEKVALLVDNQLSLYIMTFLSYVVFSVLLVVLALALNERLKSKSPVVMKIATVFALLWAGVVLASGMLFNVGMDTVVELFATNPEQAATAWLAIDTVSNGIGGGTEFVGGLWMLLVSWAALSQGGLPRVLNYLGIVVGLAGVLSDIPGLSALGMVFGLTQIVWFAWLGIVMLRGSTEASTQESGALLMSHPI